MGVTRLALSEILSTATQQQWIAVVRLCFAGEDPISLANSLGLHPATLKRKFQAIQAKREEGWEAEAIMAAGQKATLEIYAASKRNGRFPIERQKVLSWRVSASLADAVMWNATSDSQEEALVSRLKRVCRLETSDDLFEFLLSVFADRTDAELEMWAGVSDGNKKRKKTRA